MFRREIEAVLRELGIRLSEEQLSACQRYYELLVAWNARINLTATVEPRQVARRHYLESFLFALHLPDQARQVADIGSGAGFPGIPVKILRPEVALALIEPRLKRAAFLKHVVRQLGLGDVRVHSGDIESYLKNSPVLDTAMLRSLKLRKATINKLWQALPPGAALLYLGQDKDAEVFQSLGMSEQFGVPGQPGRILSRTVKSVPRGTIP